MTGIPVELKMYFRSKAQFAPPHNNEKIKGKLLLR